MNNTSTNPIIAYIGLGSNLDSPIAQIKSARQSINDLPKVQECCFSSLYVSTPMGPQDQPEYINAVIAVETSLPPLDLLHALQRIELAQGRVRTRRWGERTLDLDILLYGDKQIDTTELSVPHKGLSERAFVLYPLSECAPDLEIPGFGKLAELIRLCPFTGIQRLKTDESVN